MKPIVTIFGITLLAASAVSFVSAQTTASPAGRSKPSVSASPASASKPAAASPTATASATAATSPTPGTAPAARTDVYHVHFVKAATGKAAQMADSLKKPDPLAPMPGHTLVLRHQSGEAWDYVEISHLGTKATVEAARPQMPVEERALGDWHNDTYVSGPSWAEFTRAMGIAEDSAAKSAGSVYVVSVYRAAAGQRDALEKMLSEPPNKARDTSVGDVLMQHLEGSEWNFVGIVRYNSWQEFATNESNSVADSAKNEGGWFKLREFVASHADTVTVRIFP